MLRTFNISETCCKLACGRRQMLSALCCAAERIWLVLQLERLARMAVGHLATPGTSLLTEEA